MSRIYRCDRCGEPYDKSPFCGKPRVFYPKNGNRTSLDICPECTDQLESWLNMGVRIREEVQDDEGCESIK